MGKRPIRKARRKARRAKVKTGLDEILKRLQKLEDRVEDLTTAYDVWLEEPVPVVKVAD